MRLLVLFAFIGAVSCQTRQETALIPSLTLTIDEVLLPIPEDMPNDWGGVAGSLEADEHVLHIYGSPKKEILQYSIEQKKLINRIAPFSDTLDPKNVPVEIFKLKKGYFLTSPTLGFIILGDSGNLVKKWDDFIPRANRITSWEYMTKYRLRASKTRRLSMFNDRLIPIQVELANVGFSAVFREDFYQHDLFGILDLEQGILRRFPIRFPESFYQNGYSYPMNFLPSFTAFGESFMAYLFGTDNVINILDMETGEIKQHKISNPEFPLNIRPIDQAGYNDAAYREEHYANLSYYAGLFFDPYRKGLVRVGIKTVNGEKTMLYELLDNNFQIIGQFQLYPNYSALPIFFPNEMWFTYGQGYKEDTMKMMRVRY